MPAAASTLLMIELDGLGPPGRTPGARSSPRCVAEIGRRLRATVRGEDVVARMGGGAFAVLAEGSDADIDRLAVALPVGGGAARASRPPGSSS